MTLATVPNDTDTIVVGMAEMHVRRYPCGPLACLGLGSCIALCAYDPVHKVGGIVHIVLPSSEKKSGIVPTKYADTAVPALLEEMVKMVSEGLGSVRKLVRKHMKSQAIARTSREAINVK